MAALRTHAAGVMLGVALLGALGQATAHETATQILNKVADPYQENDPMQDPGFRDEYMHLDGSINERVLIMLQKFVPLSAGAMPEVVGIIIMFLIVGGLLYGWMQSQDCWAQRDNDNTFRLQESRRQRNLHKMDAQGV